MDPTCIWIIGGMAMGYAAVGGYVVKLHREIKDLWTARVEALEAQLAALQEGDSGVGDA